MSGLRVLWTVAWLGLRTLPQRAGASASAGFGIALVVLAVALLGALWIGAFDSSEAGPTRAEGSSQPVVPASSSVGSEAVEVEEGHGEDDEQPAAAVDPGRVAQAGDAVPAPTVASRALDVRVEPAAVPAE